MNISAALVIAQMKIRQSKLAHFAEVIFPRLSMELNLRKILRNTFIILLCWSPWMILRGPIELTNDGITMLLWMNGETPWVVGIGPVFPRIEGVWITDHHNFVSTLVFGFFDHLGRFLGNEIVGLILLKLLINFFIAFGLAATFAYLYKKLRTSYSTVLCFFFVFALLPTYAIIPQMLHKEQLWVGALLLFSLFYCESIRRIKNQEKITWRFVLSFVAVCILSALLRKTAIYVQVISLIILAVIYKRYWLKMLVLAASQIIVVLIVIPTVLFPMLDIGKGYKYEALATPAKQVASVVKWDPDSLSKTEKQELQTVFDFACVKKYVHEGNADAAKGICLKTPLNKRKIFILLKDWVVLAFKAPLSYLKGTEYLLQFFQWGHPVVGEAEVKLTQKGSIWDNDKILPEWKPGEKSKTQATGNAVLRYILKSTPLVNTTLESALYCSVLPVLLLVYTLTSKRRRANFVFLLPYFLQLLLLFASGAGTMRYTFALLYLWPISFAAANFMAAKDSGVQMPISPDLRKLHRKQ